MRDKLIELLKGAETKVSEVLTKPMELEEWLGIYADYLLENGVIVPPYEVGTKVAVITSQTSNNKNLYIFEDVITQYIVCKDYNLMCFDNNLSKGEWEWHNVFVGENAREEAEQALKGGIE